MKYKVTFRKRFDATGEGMDDPTAQVDVADGVVLDKVLVERIEAPNTHVEENAETSGEDDGFLTYGSEAWIYDVEDDRRDEFEFALRTSRVVLDYEEVEEQPVV